MMCQVQEVEGYMLLTLTQIWVHADRNQVPRPQAPFRGQMDPVRVDHMDRMRSRGG